MSQGKRGFSGRLALVLITTAVIAAAIFWLAYEGGSIGFTSGAYRINAVMPSVSTLTPGARVTMAGAQVGQVGSVTLRGNGAVVELDITDHSVTPIPADSTVALREVTPIGENYVEVTPGRARQKLPSGAVLSMSQADQYVDVDQLMSVLRGSTTTRTRQLIESLGAAVGTRGQDLNGTLAGASNTVHPLANVFRLLDNDRASVDQLSAELGDVASAAGERGSTIISLAHDGLATWRAIASQDNALRATLDQLPSTLTQVRTAANTLGDVTNTAAPVLSNLATALRDLQPAITSLKPAADEGHTVLDQLSSTAPRLNVTLSDVRQLSAPATAALPQVHKLLCQVNPMLRYIQPGTSLAASAGSYVPDLMSFISSFGSAVNAYDNIGHLVRIVPILGDNSINGLPPAISQATYDLLHAGILGDSTALTWDPYPKPGQIGIEHADAANNGVIGPSQLKAKTGYVYPHITADC
jgi:phospholipid/cholesterol/gamma-HCH transport system substrate-binding protein